MKRVIAIIVCLVIGLTLLSGCNKAKNSSAQNSNGGVAAGTGDNNNTDGTGSLSVDDMFTERDCDTSYNESTAVKIELSGSSDSILKQRYHIRLYGNDHRRSYLYYFRYSG